VLADAADRRRVGNLNVVLGVFREPPRWTVEYQVVCGRRREGGEREGKREKKGNAACTLSPFPSPSS
jgi:hypothetical protein